jgi:hypothetical protein
MNSKLIVLTALSALALTGCNDRDRNGSGMASAGNRLCKPFTTAANGQGQATPAMPMVVDGSTAVDECLHRWAYSLAASPDPADHVAQAAMAACTTALARWNQQSLSPVMGPNGVATPPAQEAPSLLTGQPTTPFQEHYTFAQGRALFYVVQARAGKCPPPPAETSNEATGAGAGAARSG